MTDNSISAYAPPPVVVPQSAFSVWAPGLFLMRRLSLRRKALVVLLAAWFPLLAMLLLLNGPTLLVHVGWLDPLRGLVDGRFASGEVPRWAWPGALATALLASLYLTVCAWKATSEGLDRLIRGAQDMAAGSPRLSAHAFRPDELGQALDALAASGAEMARLRDAAGQHGGVVARSARELADAHLALQLEALEVRAAIGEIARRTVALCGTLDSDMQDAQQVSADLDAIQDEEVHTLQLMVTLRARLLELAHRCQALGEAARGAAGTRSEAAGDSLGAPGAAAGIEIAHCHQLSERIGGAERLNERRIESMRLSADRLVCRAERGMREGQQLMVLTRQVEASLATTLLRLEQMTASCASLRALVEAPVAVTRAAQSLPD